MENVKINIGISACLVGHEVRYNGGSLKPPMINDHFAQYFNYVTFCPEVGIGMGVPRETIRLVSEKGNIRLKSSTGENDYTDAMQEYSKQKVDELSKLNIYGYILKKDSPTCGMERVKIYHNNNMPEKNGIGMFAQVLLDRFPMVPVEEEGRLKDIRLRESFVERVFAFKRLKDFIGDSPTVGKLMSFHTAHKMQLMAHNPEKFRKLGRKVALVKKDQLNNFLIEYATDFMDTLNTRASLKKQTDVLYHLLGYFKKEITSEEKQEFIKLVEQYKKQMIPFIVPLTMLRHYLKKYPDDWLQSQIYLDPYPEELMLRSYL